MVGPRRVVGGWFVVGGGGIGLGAWLIKVRGKQQLRFRIVGGLLRTTLIEVVSMACLVVF